MGPLDLQIKVALLAGVIVSASFWLYQLWAFIAPALHRKEKRTSVLFVASATPFFAMGAALGYFILPVAIKALFGFTPNSISNLVRFDDYLDFVLRLILFVGLAFELPIFLLTFNLIGFRENPYPFIKNCDIYVQTSLFEGLGLTVIEASILNKPIVTTNFPTAFSILEHKKTGVIAEMNPEDIAFGIQRVINDNDFRKQLIENLENQVDNEKEKTLKKVKKLITITSYYFLLQYGINLIFKICILDI